MKGLRCPGHTANKLGLYLGSANSGIPVPNHSPMLPLPAINPLHQGGKLLLFIKYWKKPLFPSSFGCFAQLQLLFWRVCTGKRPNSSYPLFLMLSPAHPTRSQTHGRRLHTTDDKRHPKMYWIMTRPNVDFNQFLKQNLASSLRSQVFLQHKCNASFITTISKHQK